MKQIQANCNFDEELGANIVERIIMAAQRLIWQNLQKKKKL